MKSAPSQTEWADIGVLVDVPQRGARLVKTREFGCIAIFRTANDEVFAVEDKCPHAGGPLSNGIVHGAAVTCPLHNLVVALNDGSSDSQPPALTFPLKVQDGRLFLKLAPKS